MTPESDYDDDTRRSPEEIREYLEENGVPQDIIEPVVEHLRNNETAKSLGVRQVDGYLAKQHEDLSEVHQREQTTKEAQSLAAATVVAQDTDGDATNVLDTVVYDQEDG